MGKVEVVAKGGIEAVLAAMRRHEGVAAVAERGCAALQAIGYSGGWRRCFDCFQVVVCC